MDLEVAGADRRLHPVAVAAGVRERLRDGGLADAEEAQPPQLRRLRAREQRAARARSRAPLATGAAARPAGPAARRPRCRRARARGPARCRRARASSAPSGIVACLRTPASKSAYGRPSRSAKAREMAPICSCSSSSTRSPTPAARATSSTVRSSCVGPSPPETTQRSAPRALRPAPPRAPLRGRRRSRSAPARPRAAAAPPRGTARSGRGARRARARCR